MAGRGLAVGGLRRAFRRAAHFRSAPLRMRRHAPARGNSCAGPANGADAEGVLVHAGQLAGDGVGPPPGGGSWVALVPVAESDAFLERLLIDERLAAAVGAVLVDDTGALILEVGLARAAQRKRAWRLESLPSGSFAEAQPVVCEGQEAGHGSWAAARAAARGEEHPGRFGRQGRSTQQLRPHAQPQTHRGSTRRCQSSPAQRLHRTMRPATNGTRRAAAPPGSGSPCRLCSLSPGWRGMRGSGPTSTRSRLAAGCSAPWC
jgi:hypothetical protein